MSCCTETLLGRLSQFVSSSSLFSSLFFPALISELQRHRVWMLVVFLFFVISCLWLLFASRITGLPHTTTKYPHLSDADVAAREKVLKLNSNHHDRPTGPSFQPPLSTRGRDIVDATGTRFKLTSINWYGASDSLFIPGGLEIRHRDDIASLIRGMGFNSIRLPYSDQMVRQNPRIRDQLLLANSDLFGSRALDIYKAVIDSLTGAGLAVIVNNHITQARWCCDASLCDTMWSNSYLGPLCKVSQTEDDWIEQWETIMKPHVTNPLVVGCDLRNEPRGLFGAVGWELWATAAERVSDRLLAMQPNWLMVVEGTASSNDLSRVKKRPVLLSVPGKLVYSAHVYAWSGWGQLDPYYGRNYDSFAKDMQKNWAYILESKIAPVWLSEFGVPKKPSAGDMNYWKNLIRYLAETDVDFAYWAINPRKPLTNEEESYSLLEDDWETIIYDYRLCDMQKLMSNQTSCTPL